MHFPGYEGSPCGIHRGESAAKSRYRGKMGILSESGFTGVKDFQECSGSQQARFGNLANELRGDREGGEGEEDRRREEVRKYASSKEEETRTRSLCDWGRFYGRGPQFFNSFNFFIVEQQKREDFLCSENGLDACCLTILIFLSTFKCFKGAMRPRHTYVCGFKGVGLWGERCRFMG